MIRFKHTHTHHNIMHTTIFLQPMALSVFNESYTTDQPFTMCVQTSGYQLRMILITFQEWAEDTSLHVCVYLSPNDFI